MTLYRLLVLNAQSAKTVSWIELLVKHHACLLIIVVVQPQVLRHGLLLQLLVHRVLGKRHIIDLHHILMIRFNYHIRLYMLVFKREQMILVFHIYTLQKYFLVVHHWLAILAMRDPPSEVQLAIIRAIAHSVPRVTHGHALVEIPFFSANLE